LSKPILALDVDEPTVSTGKLWKRYLDSHYTMKAEYRLYQPEQLPYDLSVMYITTEDRTGFEFFDNLKLYDNVTPREDALEYLPAISKLYDIIFISKVVGNHFCSKSKFLHKWFPYHKGFYATTRTKEHVKCDIFVDDCYSNLNDMKENNPNTVCYKFRQDYNEGVEPTNRYKIIWGYDQLYNILRRDYE
jgi:5'(3')-deoxyribonucleotidase